MQWKATNALCNGQGVRLEAEIVGCGRKRRMLLLIKQFVTDLWSYVKITITVSEFKYWASHVGNNQMGKRLRKLK